MFFKAVLYCSAGVYLYFVSCVGDLNFFVLLYGAHESLNVCRTSLWASIFRVFVCSHLKSANYVPENWLKIL